MPEFIAYSALPPFLQILHNLHVLLCGFAVLSALIPLFTAKGSLEHKFGGKIYLPVSFAALTLSIVICWYEGSVVLCCFCGFCAYLLLSGWRAVHESYDAPKLIDWLIPSGLFALAAAVTLFDYFKPSMPVDIRRNLCLAFFAFNGFYLALRDFGRLRRQAKRYRSPFLKGLALDHEQSDGWLGRHIAGMAGSVLANLSVVVLTLLPLGLHWLWPVILISLGGAVTINERRKRRAARRAIAQILQPRFGQRKPPAGTADRRRAA